MDLPHNNIFKKTKPYVKDVATSGGRSIYILSFSNIKSLASQTYTTPKCAAKPVKFVLSIKNKRTIAEKLLLTVSYYYLFWSILLLHQCVLFYCYRFLGLNCFYYLRGLSMVYSTEVHHIPKDHHVFIAMLSCENQLLIKLTFHQKNSPILSFLMIHFPADPKKF